MPAQGPTPETLAFHLREGSIDNYFYRRGPVAAHVVVTSGETPRVIVAFPAGDEGFGLWPEPGTNATIDVTAPIATAVGQGDMRGITVQLTVSRPLVVREVALAGLRSLRDYATTGHIANDLAASVDAGPPITLRRTQADGAHHLRMQLAGGAVLDGAAIHLVPGTPITLTVLADDPPLTPIETGELLDVVPPGHERELHALAFLAYREKLLAGSWRFLTYFGRDTLLTLRLLAPHAKPALVEAGLGAVIDRLDPTGDVAHEEDVGDFAAWENARDHRAIDGPRLDYKMIDDDLLLAPDLVSYLDSPAGRDRAAAFLARRTPRG